MTFITIYTSNIPVDCHILAGRLRSEGFDAFIYDENIVWVHPFRAVAIGGVKIKLPKEQVESAKLILNAITNNKLIDEEGTYELPVALSHSISKVNEILKIKAHIRENTDLLDTNEIHSDILGQEEIETLITEERAFIKEFQKEFRFSWKNFWSELLDFEGRIFSYLKPKSVDFYLEKELVDLFKEPSNNTAENTYTCPRCNSENVSFGYAIDHKWDVLYLVLSLLISFPFPPIRKNYHCFNCGNNFRK